VGHWTRVLLDIEGYRSRRERYLKDTALRAAEKAMRYREGIELDPMIPSERRIVHLTLADHEFVTTHSEGEGDSRRVIVEPTSEYVAQHGGPPEPRPGGGRAGANQGGGFSRSRGGRGRPGFGGGGGWRERRERITSAAAGDKGTVDYLLLGHLTVDRLGAKRVVLGGTATYASLDARNNGARVGIHTHAGHE